TSDAAIPAMPQSSSRPPTIARSGRSALDGTLCTCTDPDSVSYSMKSVKVPPMSTPTTRISGRVRKFVFALPAKTEQDRDARRPCTSRYAADRGRRHAAVCSRPGTQPYLRRRPLLRQAPELLVRGDVRVAVAGRVLRRLAGLVDVRRVEDAERRVLALHRLRTDEDPHCLVHVGPAEPVEILAAVLGDDVLVLDHLQRHRPAVARADLDLALLRPRAE